MKLTDECNRNLCRKIVIINKLDPPVQNNTINQNTANLGHMPSGQNTVFQVPEDRLTQFETDILIPVFATRLEELKINIHNISQKNEISPSNDQIISRNQILYGPPGTGKTYSTVKHALRIFNQIENIDNLKYEGRIEFVTFHQSFSYEDFVEGIRAETQNGHLSYAVKDGIFKKIAIDALFSKLEESGVNLDME